MKKGSICLVFVTLCCVATSKAETLVITYQGGKVQTVELEGKAEDVREVRIGASTQSMGERIRGVFFGRQPASDPAPGERKGASDKGGARIEWAPPISE